MEFVIDFRHFGAQREIRVGCVCMLIKMKMLRSQRYYFTLLSAATKK